MRRISFLFCLLICVFSGLSQAQTEELPSSTTYLGFNPFTGQNNLELAILYIRPDPAVFPTGPVGIAIWLPAKFELSRDLLGLTFIRQMAKRGFLAASVQYSNTESHVDCVDLIPRALGVFEEQRPTSAVSVLCRLSGDRCEQRIVTAGLSHGAGLAVLAENYASRVAAVYAISIGDVNLKLEGSGALPCLDDPVTTISSDRLTIINGEHDELFGGQTQLMNVSGISCPVGTFQCWSRSGSGAGWYMVKDSQVRDGRADHCYIVVGGCFLPVAFDPSWYLEASFNWSLKSNLDWLATFGTHRVFSSSGQ